MLLYLTKQTIDRYKVQFPSAENTSPQAEMHRELIQREQGDELLEWGGKLFYFEGRKCVQVVNFASKLTLFFIDIKKDALGDIGKRIVYSLYVLYIKDPEMQDALKKMTASHPIVCFERLKDKSAISTLNYTQKYFLEDGAYLYRFMKEGSVNVRDLNREVNFNYLITSTVHGKKEYRYPGEAYRELMMERFGE